MTAKLQAPPTREELLDRVARIAPMLADTAAESEDLRTLCPRAVAALDEAGLFRLWSPIEVGGFDADFVTQTDVMIELARADMSACWTVMIGASLAAVMATGLPEAGLAEVFTGAHFPTAAGSLKPAGRAQPVEGGYLVSGQWGFGSGIHHAGWIVANCLETRDGQVRQPPEQVSAVVPVGEVTIADDWHVSGLSGSGSSSYSVERAFVPEQRVMKGGPKRGSQQNRDMLPRIPLEHASVSLGGARRALDEVKTQAASKHRLIDPASVASKQAFQVELGRLDAEWQALRAGVRAAAAELWEALGEGAPEAPAVAVELRAVCALATERALDIGGRAFRHAGAGAVLATNVLQRVHRDLTVSAQHVMISDLAYELHGRRLLGMD